MSQQPPYASSSGYAYPSSPPANGYYSYATQPQYAPPPTDYQHYYQPQGQAYNYNPYAFAPPPSQSQPGYYPTPPQPQQSQSSGGAVTYTFERSGDKKGWNVYDPMGALIFEVTYKKAGLFKHDGCEVRHGAGGAVLATVFDAELCAGSFRSECKYKSSHGGKFFFSDPHSREYAFRETKDWDLLLVYPSKETIAQGNVKFDTGKGVMKILDPMQAPDAPILIAAYVELKRKQQSNAEAEQAGINGAIAGAGI